MTKSICKKMKLDLFLVPYKNNLKMGQRPKMKELKL